MPCAHTRLDRPPACPRFPLQPEGLRSKRHVKQLLHSLRKAGRVATAPPADGRARGFTYELRTGGPPAAVAAAAARARRASGGGEG